MYSPPTDMELQNLGKRESKRYVYVFESSSLLKWG